MPKKPRGPKTPNLTGESFRLEIQDEVRKLSQQGLSANEIQRRLRQDFGKSYRRQELISDIRRYKDQPRKADAEKYTPEKYRTFTQKDLPVSKDELWKRRLWEWDKKYNHYIEYEVRNKKTGKIEKRMIILKTDYAPTHEKAKFKNLGQLLREAKDKLSKRKYKTWGGEPDKDVEVIKGSVKYAGTVEKWGVADGAGGTQIKRKQRRKVP